MLSGQQSWDKNNERRYVPVRPVRHKPFQKQITKKWDKNDVMH